MEMLANYGEDSEPMNSSFENEKKPTNLEDQYSMFEQMIGVEAPDDEQPNATADVSKFLNDGVVAYPSAKITSEGSETSGTNEKSVGRCSLAESVKKIMEKNSEVKEDGGEIKRLKSVSSDSASSRDSSKSRSPSSSPERKSRERKISTTSVEGDKAKPPAEEKRQSKSPSKRKKSKSRSKSPHRRKSDHHRSGRRRSRSRDRKKERHSSRSRRHKRSKSRDRKHKRRHSSRNKHDKKRSRSRSKDRNKKHRRSRDGHSRRSKKSKSRSRSRHRSPHRHRSPDRHRRSRSPERKRRSPTSANQPFTFKDQMRQQLLKASKILQNNEGIDGKEMDLPKEKPSNLPLNSKDVFSSISLNSSVTPQMALLQTMATMHQKAQEMTGIAVPKYYNPAAVNPLKYAEQVQKRKLLWSKAKDHKEDKEKEWKTSAALASDSDGKTTAKFCKLMGIKAEGDNQSAEGEDNEEVILEKKKQHAEFFSRLDKDYEFARMTTHTQRGVGLGFSSSQQQFPVQHQ